MKRRPQIVVALAAVCGAALPFAAASLGTSRPRTVAQTAAGPEAGDTQRRHLRTVPPPSPPRPSRGMRRRLPVRPPASSTPSDIAAKAAPKARASQAPAVLRGRRASPSSEARRDARPPGLGGLNWPALAMCESSGNPRAVSKSGRYRGLYQFDLATWRSVGGVGDPADATVEEQTKRAWMLYQRRGRQPWPECGRRL